VTTFNLNAQCEALGIWQDSFLFRVEDVPCTELERELVFLSIENGKYYTMKGTARRVWELLSMPTRLDGLIKQLSGEYGIDTERCVAETLPFLRSLIEAGLAKASRSYSARG
jgi:hypothetical protein